MTEHHDEHHHDRDDESPVDDAVPTELAHEQQHLDVLYDRVDTLSAAAETELRLVQRAGASGTPQARSERDAFAGTLAARVAQLRAVQDRLCFGRLDLRDGQRHHIGRIGLSDPQQQKLLVDWRAPVAAPFYQATPAAPGDVVRRRHLTTRGRQVVHLEDEVLDLEAVHEGQVVAGEGALLVALNARRTGRMRDIVATIQAEQDRVVRSPLDGVLVVQGGPGTGKTAVALHRAAYLLYTYRDRIARAGVLLVGPNRRFLRYIEQVLPSLGETGVVMRTPATLFPGVEATGREPSATAQVKGSARMAQAMAEAVRRRQRVPRVAVPLSVDGYEIELRPREVEAARAQARRTRAPHNIARVTFVKEILRSLAVQLAEAQGVDVDADNRRELDAELRAAPDVKRAVNRCWLPYTPQRLLSRLLARESWLAELPLSAPDRALLLRAEDAPFTPADVPLLDELATLLGEDDDAQRLANLRAARERRVELSYAQGVLEMTSAHRGPGQLAAGDVVDAERLADRWSGGHTSFTVAERAADDREWVFGHVVVDEAQELSPMQWRMVMKRVPSRSMTVVGDIAQTGSVSGARSWADVFDGWAPGHWRAEELTVNYRTPAQVMDVAADVLAVAQPGATVPVSARVGEWSPRAIPCDTSETVVEVVRRELARFATVAVIAPDDLVETTRETLSDGLPPGALGLDAPVSVLDVTAVKGLEFDAVVLVEPARILAASPRGASDLYVALTRATQDLAVLHSEPLPAVLRALAGSGDRPGPG
ncbi:MAG TPA: AAA family ATPase [Mycobacteriales bacterium]